MNDFDSGLSDEEAATVVVKGSLKMSDVERLQEAARVLRKAAQEATPGPWEVDGQGPGPEFRNMGCGVVYTMHESVLGGDIAMPAGDMYPRGGYSPMEDMTYIATVNPEVGLAVAEWLDHYAAQCGILRVEPGLRETGIANAVLGPEQ